MRATRTSLVDKRLAVVCLLLVALGGCSWMPFIGGGDDDETTLEDEIETSEQKLYRDAQRWLRSSNYQQAIAALERLEARFPFGRYAEQAQLEMIYARYMSANLDGARTAADRFIRLHPNHTNIDYAFYIKGLASFSENSGLMDRLVKVDESKRDMAPLRDAYSDFAQLMARYPNSPYIPDTRQRMVHLRNVLARSELSVADYYLRRGAYVAAANRARHVLENYPNAESTPEALIVLAECNHKLGLEDEANNTMRVLAINFPDHNSFDENGNLVLANRIRNRDRSWTNIMTLGIFDRPSVPPPLTIQHPEGFTPPAKGDRPSAAPGRGEDAKKRGWFSWLPFVD
ncbi:MAG: outer membrane protein assembly factor BamD [Pseudomonadales bacterium]|nr:outer membrane protein assembly factor BamD [Pseudomonadales bacterium]